MYISVSRVFLIRRPFRPARLLRRTADTAACAPCPIWIRRRTVCRRLPPSWSASARMPVLDVTPYGAITAHRGGRELADMEQLAPYVAGFSDDGSGVQDADVMRAAMRKAASLGKLIAAHCEDNTLLHGGYIHDGAYARAHGHKGISSESEWRQLGARSRAGARDGSPTICATCPPRRAWRSSAGRRRRGWTSPARPHRTTSC